MLQLKFGVCALCLRALCVFVHPSGFVPAITCTFMHISEKRSRSAI